MVHIAEIETRQAEASDADAMAVAHRDSIRSIGSAFYPAQVIDDWEEAVTEHMYVDAMSRGEVFFIATGRIDDRILVIGFASDYCIEGSIHGTSVYVRGVAARLGIGTRLYRLAEAYAMANGAKIIRVEASLAGVAFYAARGFVEVGRGETRLGSGSPIACVFMVKELRRGARRPLARTGVAHAGEDDHRVRRATTSSGNEAPTTDNAQLIRRWIAFANAGFSGDFQDFIASNYIGHLGAMTMDSTELERLEREFCAAFPDAQYAINDLIAVDDRVVLRTMTRATHRGEFQGIQRTDRLVEFTGIVIYRIRGGKIADSWGEIDFLRLMQQLRGLEASSRLNR